MAAQDPVRPPARLVVNADDFGYFGAVTRGILETVDAGTVTATGVLANGPALAEHAGALRERPEVDAGVHLNLTLGEPLTGGVRERLSGSGGCWPGRAGLLAALLSRALRPADLMAELRAQIERCLGLGLVVRFLNGHEHVHMLPGVFPRVRALAAEYGIAFVRFVTPEWRTGTGGLRAGHPARSAVLQMLAWLHWRAGPVRGPRLVGAGASGQLTAADLDRRLARLVPGRDYELMCHPGFRDAGEVRDPGLLAFHHWDEERELLAGPGFRARCEAFGVSLARFRDLGKVTPGAARASVLAGRSKP
ncbi:MAG: ChbG/HpnK family deacetylase [Gammaproteobacteria bacterium]|jgi:hypothetical protein|nr:ChbG/HpnK family deacetylase [Gammaproteobacteria bacterium]